MTPTFTLADLSGMDQPAFVAALDGIYEHSPWVAAGAWALRPFATLPALATALEAVMLAADPVQQHALICAHPELAGRAAMAGGLTTASNSEQQGAGLLQCSPVEFAQLQALNTAYRQRFGFPFVVAVRGLSRQDIIAQLATRLQATPQDEYRTALQQIARIAGWRLAERIAG
ncbi:MAG: 2-oxo-4-hydroxy-4-carboxy-5-ureidoimidazoline decarboxylase [Vogesella sp.]|uniref:2-oxo-4-hydroxy-4-carboxy-5-ureidoimidazoline decarboxylase n=1 Tax=Vogesella sp. TaxID=1904252 RepID=UPI003F3E608F